MMPFDVRSLQSGQAAGARSFARVASVRVPPAWTKQQVITVLQAMFSVSAILRVTLQGRFGLLTRDVWQVLLGRWSR